MRLDSQFVFIIIVSIGAFFIGYFFSREKVALKNKPAVLAPVEDEEPLVELNSYADTKKATAEPEVGETLFAKPGQVKATQTRGRGGKLLTTLKDETQN